jgi:hypothetical protein
MPGFLVLIFIYLFILLMRNTEKSGRSSLVQSLIFAAVAVFVLSLFSLVAFGVIFLFLLFIPFFFLPSGRLNGTQRAKQQEDMKDFFEHLRNQERARQRYREDYRSPSNTKMSDQEAALLLGVSVDATPMQIKSAYRKLMLKHHPDKGGSAEYAAKLNTARDTLMAKYK